MYSECDYQKNALFGFLPKCLHIFPDTTVDIRVDVAALHTVKRRVADLWLQNNFLWPQLAIRKRAHFSEIADCVQNLK